jgi:hypothetical protein
MDFLKKLLKFLVLVGLIVAIPVLWFQLVSSGSLGFKGILFATGGSLVLMGVCYKLLGNWDLIPDWLPLIGGMDDSAAWIVILVGAGIGGIGFLF